jgi:hypothetical protein
MAIRQITLPKQKDSVALPFLIKTWKGDSLVLVFESLKPDTSFVLTFALKLGSILFDLTNVLNSLPAFSNTGNLTQSITTDTNGVGTVTISANQTAALSLKSNYVLEVEINGDSTIETYGQYSLYVEQEIVSTATPGPQYNYLDTQILSSSGSTANLDYNTGFIFSKSISSQQTLTVANSKNGQMVLLITTNTVANISPPILPANCQLFADNWDSQINTTNLICFLCTDKTTPKFLVTYNSKLN